jgi:hypothetical protein
MRAPGLGTADQFDEDVDIGGLGQSTGRRTIRCRRLRSTPRSRVRRAPKRRYDRSAAACRASIVAACAQNARQRSTNGAQARNSDFKGISHVIDPEINMRGSRLKRRPLRDYYQR